MKRATLFALVLLTSTVEVRAQTTRVELSGQAQSLSGGYQSGGGFGLRVTHVRSRDSWVLFGERISRFGDDGLIGGLANTHIFNPDWYTYLAASSSTDGFFLPKYRFDAQVARKLGRNRSWVATLGGFTAATRDEHQDVAAVLGLVRYFAWGMIAEAGGSINRSSPGDVVSARYSVAATYGRDKSYYLSLRANGGGEAYQQIGPSAALIDFQSKEFGARYQKWLRPDAGVVIAADYYTNPYYHRVGTTVAIFAEFGK